MRERESGERASLGVREREVVWSFCWWESESGESTLTHKHTHLISTVKMARRLLLLVAVVVVFAAAVFCSSSSLCCFFCC